MSLNAASADRYHARFRQVLDYIDAHLEELLTVERLSRIAAFSQYHFHRQFSALFGIGVVKYVQLRRLKRASYQVAFRNDRRVIDIALGNGYESPEAFSRAFKRTLGQAPSAFRSRPEWDVWHTAFQPLAQLRNMHMTVKKCIDQVNIIDFKETKVAVFEHRGDPRRIGDSVRSFIAWRKQNHLPPKVSATYNILYDSPDEVAPEDFRLDICAATDRQIAANAFGVVEKTIPAGRCAVLRHVGSDDNLGDAIACLYTEWLPQSGEEPRDFPVYLQRVKFFPDVPENETVIDVFLPIK